MSGLFVGEERHKLLTEWLPPKSLSSTPVHMISAGESEESLDVSISPWPGILRHDMRVSHRDMCRKMAQMAAPQSIHSRWIVVCKSKRR